MAGGRRARDWVHPEVRAAWTTQGRDREQLLLEARSQIDNLGSGIHSAFVAGLEFFILIWLIQGRRGTDWAAGLKRNLVRYVAWECRRQKTNPVLVKVYYQPLFNGMLDNLIGLLGDGQVDLDFLLQGLPSARRDEAHRFASIDLADLREGRSVWLRFRPPELGPIFNLTTERLAVVMDVGLAKGPDKDPHVPVREEENRQAERKRCRREGISREITERYYVRSLQGWMNAATDVQYVVRRNPDLFRIFLDKTREEIPRLEAVEIGP
ncbi:MAG TPA: hypothetical protein VIH52_01125 [Candidatus Nanoarchaeia archaeon]|nr:hypothetical protein [uncultured archaeon]